MSNRRVIVLTGGPGGGKSTLIKELFHDPVGNGRFIALPEAVYYAGAVGISPHKKLFQRMMVNLQIALEDGLRRSLDPEDLRIILCHRGGLDPLAYWFQQGWKENDFFEFVGMSRDAEKNILGRVQRTQHFVNYLEKCAAGIHDNELQNIWKDVYSKAVENINEVKDRI